MKRTSTLLVVVAMLTILIQPAMPALVVSAAAPTSIPYNANLFAPFTENVNYADATGPFTLNKNGSDTSGKLIGTTKFNSTTSSYGYSTGGYPDQPAQGNEFNIAETYSIAANDLHCFGYYVPTAGQNRSIVFNFNDYDTNTTIGPWGKALADSQNGDAMLPQYVSFMIKGGGIPATITPAFRVFVNSTATDYAATSYNIKLDSNTTTWKLVVIPVSEFKNGGNTISDWSKVQGFKLSNDSASASSGGTPLFYLDNFMIDRGGPRWAGYSAAPLWDFNVATALASPKVTGYAGDRKVSLSWGAVPNAMNYDVYKASSSTPNPTGGDTKIATVTGTYLQASDDPGDLQGLTNGTTYYFYVIANPDNSGSYLPSSPPTTATAVTPTNSPKIGNNENLIATFNRQGDLSGGATVNTDDSGLSTQMFMIHGTAAGNVQPNTSTSNVYADISQIGYDGQSLKIYRNSTNAGGWNLDFYLADTSGRVTSWLQSINSPDGIKPQTISFEAKTDGQPHTVTLLFQDATGKIKWQKNVTLAQTTDWQLITANISDFLNSSSQPMADVDWFSVQQFQIQFSSSDTYSTVIGATLYIDNLVIGRGGSNSAPGANASGITLPATEGHNLVNYFDGAISGGYAANDSFHSYSTTPSTVTRGYAQGMTGYTNDNCLKLTSTGIVSGGQLEAFNFPNSNTGNVLPAPMPYDTYTPTNGDATSYPWDFNGVTEVGFWAKSDVPTSVCLELDTPVLTGSTPYLGKDISGAGQQYKFIDNNACIIDTNWTYIREPMSNFLLSNTSSAYLTSGKSALSILDTPDLWGTMRDFGIILPIGYSGNIYIDDIVFYKNDSCVTPPRPDLVGSMSDATLSGISVDGTALTGFNANTTTYTVLVDSNATLSNLITATATQNIPMVSNSIVTITQPAAIPGTATIVVTAPDRTTTKTYTINVLGNNLACTGVTYITSGTSVTATANFSNNSGATATPRVIVCVYKTVDGVKVLYNLKISNMTPVPDGTTSQDISVTVTRPDATYSVVTYVWDGLDTMVPLINSVSEN